MSLLLGASAFVFSCCCLAGALITLLPEIASRGKRKNPGWWVWISGAVVGLAFFYISAVTNHTADTSMLSPLQGVYTSETAASFKAQTAEAVEQIPAAPSAAPIKAGEQVKYIGGINGNMYHIPGCYLVKRMPAENQRFFLNKQQAETAGYKACPECKP